MFHKSTMSQFHHRFPHDKTGHVPVHTDHWREMQFDYEGMDPDEEGISEEEKARRIDYLDHEWWPRMLQQVEEERERLEAEHGETFIKHWNQVHKHHSEVPHGFQVAPELSDEDEECD